MEVEDDEDDKQGVPPRRHDDEDELGGYSGGGEGERERGRDRKSFGLFGGVVCPVLKRSEKGVENQQQQRVKELLSGKKLALVLDLDHTLLHTAHAQTDTQRQVMLRAQSMSRDVVQIWCKGTGKPQF